MICLAASERRLPCFVLGIQARSVNARRLWAWQRKPASLAFATSWCRIVLWLPIKLQAQLLAKLASFDRNFAARAGSTARVLIVHKPGDDESLRVANNIAREIGELHEVGGVTAQVEVAAYPGAAALGARCRSQKTALVYYSSGLEGDMGQAAEALAGADVLTIGASPAHAERGSVVGFDLEGGKPKVVVNVTRGKAQNVSFKAELLKLARIVG